MTHGNIFKNYCINANVYGNWCGPGYSGPGDPIDVVDMCCKSHDQCYDQRGYSTCSCDKELLQQHGLCGAISNLLRVNREN